MLAETHAQEGARQGKRKRRRRKRRRKRCKSSWLLSTFFGNGLLEGRQSPRAIVWTAEGKAMKDKTKNNSKDNCLKKKDLN